MLRRPRNSLWPPYKIGQAIIFLPYGLFLFSLWPPYVTGHAIIFLSCFFLLLSFFLAGWIKMPLGTEVNFDPGDVVLDEVAAPFPLKWHTPSFRFISLVSRTAGWMKTSLGTEVNLGQCHIVLDGVPAPRERGTAPPLFGPRLLWPLSSILATAEFLLGHRLAIFTYVRMSVRSQSFFSISI